MKAKCTRMTKTLITVEPLFKGHSRDQGKCPLNGGWAGVC